MLFNIVYAKKLKKRKKREKWIYLPKIILHSTVIVERISVNIEIKCLSLKKKLLLFFNSNVEKLETIFESFYGGSTFCQPEV